MIEVVECFVVAHWAVFHNNLTDQHVSRTTTNVIDIKKEKNSYQPKELYESLTETFSKRGGCDP